MTESFTASVQYDDWKGTAAADGADNTSPQEFFREKGVPKDAYVVGIRAYYLASGPGKIGVRAVYADGEGFDSVNSQIMSTNTLQFKELNLEITFDEFFRLFKRFNIVLSSKGLGLEGREYTIENEE